uniref:Uncharacterized protein n=1 Tax=Astyanax mexicanus TaxID=7994 RepID=A0A8B9HGA5_ASTMX
QDIWSAVYLNECPQQHYIPVYLVVCGVFCIGPALLCCLPCCPGLDVFCIIWNGLVAVFMFCWFITGSVWIYSIYPPNYNYNSTEPVEPYCNKTLYLFAFWTTTLGFIPLAFSVLICVLHFSRRGFTNVFFFA